jgi:tagatose-1,6-bisphosphate aldolase
MNDVKEFILLSIALVASMSMETFVFKVSAGVAGYLIGRGIWAYLLPWLKRKWK